MPRKDPHPRIAQSQRLSRLANLGHGTDSYGPVAPAGALRHGGPEAIAPDRLLIWIATTRITALGSPERPDLRHRDRPRRDHPGLREMAVRRHLHRSATCPTLLPPSRCPELVNTGDGRLCSVRNRPSQCTPASAAAGLAALQCLVAAVHPVHLLSKAQGTTAQPAQHTPADVVCSPWIWVLASAPQQPRPAEAGVTSRSRRVSPSSSPPASPRTV
jgi:hypothetical protein